MSSSSKKPANRPNRKATDGDIIRLNSIGFSLGSIAKRLEVHQTTIHHRLKALAIPPADTRHAFMERVCGNLSETQLQWLADQVGPHLNIQSYVTDLIVREFLRKTGGSDDRLAA